LDGSTQTVNSFYSANCRNSNTKCVLKLSIIGSIKDTLGVQVPFLEYQIQTSNPVPTGITQILAQGDYNGYTKQIDIKIPQASLNQAFDFTVFQ